MLKRFGLCAAALLVASIGTATQALAAPVTFTTTGAFTSSGTSIFTSGSGATGITISFTGFPTTVDAPSSVTFGQFTTSGTTATSAQTLSDTFTLSIFQTVPGVGTGTFVGSLAGTLRISSSKAYIDFGAPLTIVVGGVTYTLTEADGGVAGRADLKPPSSGGGISTVEGTVSIPEPASALLLGLGLLGSAAAARRRRNARA